MMTFNIAHASPQDAAAVVALRQDAEEWLARRGVAQWTNTERGIQNTADHIAAGATYVVRSTAGQVVASITLDEGDPDFWTAEEMAEPAIYLYKFMIAEHCRGTGLGDVLLDWACEMGAQQGAKELRLDCWRTNTALHRYFLARGFRHLTTRTAEGRMSGALFSRPTSLRLSRLEGLRLVRGDEGGLGTETL